MVIRKLPAFLNVAKIERDAGNIRDPLQRLKYLRQATTAPPPAPRRHWRPVAILLLALLVVPLASDAIAHKQPELAPPPPPPAFVQMVDFSAPDVWIVEANKDYEVYSNGLRVENRMAVSNKARSFPLMTRNGVITGARREQPMGIVYHTTESDQAPFEADQKPALQRIGQELLIFVRNKRAYHYLIDRFGRVNRIVVETDEANHAGHSVWADAQYLYLGLNASFLGVAFEARMQTDQPPINEAQVHAAKILTDMLRSKYRLAAENCVTHAQVSVNPDNMRIGWHSDWGRNFPFQEVGLPDNYEQPLPSLYMFGFEYDPIYTNVTGPDLWKGLARAEEQVRQSAAAKHMAVASYRTLLEKRYRDQLAALRHRGANEEN